MAKFINDIPDRNEFEEKNSFAMNKKVLEDIISNNEIEKNKIIALSGKWGSGKSTVLKMINDDDSNKIKVVDFDVLSYSDDQIRRSFLLNLYKKLNTTINNFNKQESSKLEKYITGNVKEYAIKQKTTWRSITKVLVLLSLSYIAIYGIYKPISFLYDNYDKLIFLKRIMHNLSCNNDNFNKGILSLIIFIVALLIFIIIFLIKRKKDKLKFSKAIKELWENIMTYIFPFVNGESNIDQTTTEETDNNDLTGYEFREYYKKIIEQYFKTNNDNILIAIDNLDRMKTDKIKDIVYNLFLFLSVNDECNKNNEVKNNVYFLVLIDKTNFFRYNSNETHNEDNIHNAQFFEKVFPIRLELSNIVNLNWRKFFKDKINNAFDIENISGNIVEYAIWLYEEFEDSDIVPRDIIYFINKVVYNYKIINNSNILEEDSDKFKSASLNALYTMFVEERKSNSLWTNINNIQTFVKEIKNAQDENGNEEMDSKENESSEENKKVEIKKLLDKYSNNWEELLYYSYYQTDSPYNALYGDELKTYLIRNDKGKIKNLKETLNKKGNDGKSIFEILFKNAIEKIGKTDDIESWKNIIDYYLENDEDKLLKVNEIEELFPNEIKYCYNLGLTFGNLYIKFPDEEKIINIINKVFRMEYAKEEIENIEDEYIKLVNILDKEKVEHVDKIKLYSYENRILHIKIINKVNEKNTKIKIFDNCKGYIVSDIEKIVKELVTYINSLSESKDEDSILISIFKLLNFYIENNYCNLDKINSLIINIQTYIKGNINFYKELLKFYELFYNLIETIEEKERDNILSVLNTNLNTIYNSTEDVSLYILSINLLLKFNITSLTNIKDTFTTDNNIEKIYKVLNEQIGWENFISNLHSSKSDNLKLIYYYYFIRDIKDISNKNKLIKLLDIDIISNCYYDETICENIENYDFDNFYSYFREFINLIFDNYSDLFQSYFDMLKEDMDKLYDILIENISDKLNEDLYKELLEIYKSSDKYSKDIFNSKSEGLLELLINSNKINCLEFDELDFSDKVIEYMEIKNVDIIEKYLFKKNKIFSTNARKEINNKLENIDLNIDINSTNFEEYLKHWEKLDATEINILPIIKKLSNILRNTPEDNYKLIFKYLIKNIEKYKDKIKELIEGINLNELYNNENTSEELKKEYDNFVNKLRI